MDFLRLLNCFPRVQVTSLQDGLSQFGETATQQQGVRKIVCMSEAMCETVCCTYVYTMHVACEYVDLWILFIVYVHMCVDMYVLYAY